MLLRVTIYAIHVNEDKELRERIEREYIKALGFLSAVEEQKQIYAMGEPPTHHDLFVDGMKREVFTHLEGEELATAGINRLIPAVNRLTAGSEQRTEYKTPFLY